MITTKEQLDIINNFIQGTPVYYRNKCSSDKFKWKLIGREEKHQFDFENNVYYINTPPTFEEVLAQVEPCKAFSMALDHIKVNDCDFIVDCSTKDENDREIDRFQVVKLDKLYKLWNIASNYGHLRTEELKFLSEEEGKVRGFL